MVVVPRQVFSGPLGVLVVALAVLGLMIAVRLATTGTQRAHVREILTPGDWWPRLQAVAIGVFMLPIYGCVRLAYRLEGDEREHPPWYLDGTEFIIESSQSLADRLELEATVRAAVAALGAMLMVLAGESIGRGRDASPSVAGEIALVGLLLWFALVALGAVYGRLRVHPGETSEVADP